MTRMRDIQQSFLNFLYSASISVLIGRILAHQASDDPKRLNSSHTLLEILLLLGIITLVSTDWLARRYSRERAEKDAKGVSRSTLLTVAFWIFEVMGLAVVILAAGTFIPSLCGGTHVDLGSLPFQLFGAWATLTFLWEAMLIRRDPLDFVPLYGAALFGSVLSLETVKTRWVASFRELVGVAVKKTHDTDGVTVAWPLLGRTAEVTSELVQQFIALHICVLNFTYGVILIFNPIGQSRLAMNDPAGELWNASSLGFGRNGWSLLVVVVSIFLLRCVAVSAESGNPGKAKKGAASKWRLALNTATNLGILAIFIQVVLSVSLTTVVLLMLLEQLFVTLSFIPATEEEQEPPKDKPSVASPAAPATVLVSGKAA